jgi:hypothetical protein
VSDLTLFDLFEPTDDPRSPLVTAVHGPEAMRGHIAIADPKATSTRHTSLVDMGNGTHLHLYAGTSVTFTPESARQLGEALVKWAAMRELTPDEIRHFERAYAESQNSQEGSHG